MKQPIMMMETSKRAAITDTVVARSQMEVQSEPKEGSVWIGSNDDERHRHTPCHMPSQVQVPSTLHDPLLLQLSSRVQNVEQFPP